MSELQFIESVVQRTANRRRLERGLHGLSRGLFFGSILLVACLIGYKVFPLSPGIVEAAAAVVILAGGGGFIRGWLRKPTVAETARWVDRNQQLKERLSTALEIGTTHPASGWRDLLITDAAQSARKLDPRVIIPVRLHGISRWALVLLALGAGLGFVPEYRSKAHLQRQKDAEVLRDVGQQLANLSRRDLSHRPPVLEPTERALKDIQALGDELKKAKLTRDDALKDLASVTDKIKQQVDQMARTPVMKMLERAAREPEGGSSSPSELQQRMASLQQRLGDAAKSPDALDQLKAELDKAREEASELPDKDSATGAAAREALAKNLAALARRAKDLGHSLDGLDQAISALQAEQSDLFLKDLDSALQDLDKLRAMAKALNELQQQASKLGKDLAEQLKLGQVEAARQSLQQMIDLLKSSSLSPDQLQKMLQEVAKAVDPAKQYGKASECLAKAGSSLKSGDKASSAASLAEAQKELENLLEQMGDGQSLMAALEALQKAQYCVGNGEGWGQCKKPGLGQGGKPGSGVGTWADEEGWLHTPEMTERWDNTGLERPDMDPRGLTDRGEGKLADNLDSTKIRGQISPGGPMPSISLKGVSIKGQSRVEYEEAAAAAQSDAQSALNQDKVPRAYQGAVRDYFGDLKQ